MNNNLKYELEDDRMSLSSLSSGEKLELPDDSERNSFLNNKGFVPFTINSNENALKRSKYSSWKSNSIDTIKINNQNFKFQISTTSTNLNNSSFFETSNNNNKRSNYLLNNSSSSKRFNDVFDMYDDLNNKLLQNEDANKFKRSRLQKIKQGVIKLVVAELKGIIQKDISKKMIESTAFKIYENWWDESEKQFKLKKEQKEQKEQKENQENLNLANDKIVKSNSTKASIYKEDPSAWSSVLSASSYNNKTSNSNPFNLSEGYQFGHLRAAMPKMPSFKRKVKQARNEDSYHHQKDYKKTSIASSKDAGGGISENEFEKISSDDNDETLNGRKYVKNRSAAIIDNDLMDSLSDDDDDEDEDDDENSSSGLSSTKFKEHKRKQLSKNRSIKSSKSSLSSSSSSSASSSSFSSSSSASDNSASSNESSGSEEEEGEVVSGSESDNKSHRSSISASSLESFDRTSKKIKSSISKKIKSTAESISSKKSSLLSSISQSSISSNDDEVSRNSLSAIESEDESISSSNRDIKLLFNDKQQEDKQQEQVKQIIEKEKLESKIGTELIDKPIAKRKVGRPPKNKQQQQKSNNKVSDKNKTTNSSTTSTTLTLNKINEKENVKPLKEDSEDRNDLMTREEIEASEALMALSNFFGSGGGGQSTTQATNKQQQQNDLINSLPQPKPIIILSEEQKSINSTKRSIHKTASSFDEDADTDSASESELMKTIFETPEESVAIDHSYCIPALRKQMLKSKYDNNFDFSSIFDDDQMQSDHLYSKISQADNYIKEKGKNKKQAMFGGKKGRKSKVSKVNDENVDLNELIIEKPKIKFTARSRLLEEEILLDFIQNGIDSEDIRYLKRSYDSLLQEDTNYKWLNESHWSEHPPTKILQPIKKKKKTDELRTHLTGCARTEGYYKMTDKEKEKSSYVVNAAHEADEENENDDLSKALRARVPTTQQATREARSNQRRLLATVDVAWSDLLKFNQLQFRKKQLKFARSIIHDWGLFALEPIAADEMVIEYVGQMIRPVVADLREKKYNEMGIGSSYLFRVDLETIIDATKVGNLARFINHSCTVSIIVCNLD